MHGHGYGDFELLQGHLGRQGELGQGFPGEAQQSLQVQLAAACCVTRAATFICPRHMETLLAAVSKQTKCVRVRRLARPGASWYGRQMDIVLN